MFGCAETQTFAKEANIAAIAIVFTAIWKRICKVRPRAYGNVGKFSFSASPRLAIIGRSAGLPLIVRCSLTEPPQGAEHSLTHVSSLVHHRKMGGHSATMCHKRRSRATSATPSLPSTAANNGQRAISERKK